MFKRIFRSFSSSTVKNLELHDQHVKWNGKLVNFGGFNMPIKYNDFGEIKEHRATRKNAGLFDVSHMGEFLIEGPESGKLVQRLVTNNVKKLEDNMAMYSPMCTPCGSGTIDDLLIYRKSQNQYMLVVNASNIEKDWTHINGVRLGQLDLIYNQSTNLDYIEYGFNCNVTDLSEEMGLLAIQGPKSFDMIKRLIGIDFSKLKYYRFNVIRANKFNENSLADDIKNEIIVSRTGYTGESNGLEIYCNKTDLSAIWKGIIMMGATPCGLASRDMLRIEAGFSLYGHELTPDINPLEANLGWAVKMKAGRFIGRTGLKNQIENGVSRKIVGFIMDDDKSIPRQNYPVVELQDNEKIVGIVTSGTRSPMLDKGVGLALIDNDKKYTTIGNQLGIKIRKKVVPMFICKTPLYKS
tara:strand:- start:738 stop:1964 length:1227 start_codon:yes stop_codon:yes gene_type:complete